MAVDSSVTADDVRTELNEIPEDVVAQSVIEQQLSHAEFIVGQYATDDASGEALDYAVTIVAAYGALTSDSGGWQTVAEELDAREEYDVGGMVESLEAKRAEALGFVAPGGGGPSLESLGDRYPRS